MGALFCPVAASTTIVPKSAGDEKQKEIDKAEEDDPGSRRNQFVAQSAKGSPFISHGHHGARVVMNPANKQRPEQKPQQGRKPSPLNGNDRPDDRCCAGNRFELVTEEDVLTGGHELHSIHIHLGRSGPLGISLHDFRIDVLGVERGNR